MIVIIDPSGGIVEYNKPWEHFAEKQDRFGLTGDNYFEILKKSDSKNSDYINAVIEGIKNVVSGNKKDFKTEFLIKQNKSEHWFYLLSTPLSEGDFGKTVISHDNITSRKKYEISLRASEEKYRSIVKNLGIGVVLINKDMVIAEANEKIGEWFSNIEKSIKYKNFMEVFSFLREDSSFCTVENTMKSGNTYLKKIKYSDRIFRIISSPLFDEKLRVQGVILMLEDITERLGAETRIRHAQKMEALGTLAGGIAHDFNNILGAVMGYTELALLSLEKESEESYYIENIYKAVLRATGLVRQILTFSRKSEFNLKPVDPAAIINEALKLLRASIPSTIEIKKRVEPDTEKILVDPDQVHQIIMNLCTNAYHAIGGQSGFIEIELKNADKSEVEKISGIKKGTKGAVVLKVRDSGCGMTQDIKDSLFVPYFTTKAKDVGTGLGLSVVHGIVKECGGDIDVDSEPGQGTSFYIYFPACQDVYEPNLYSFEKEEVQGGDEKILIIEDEQSLLNAGAKILEKSGYSVTKLSSGIQALNLLKDSPYDYDMVITDFTMPGFKGDKIAEEVMNINPDLPVMIWTGGSVGVSEKNSFFTSGVKDVLIKPFSKDLLLKKVRKILSEA
jgi:PAS domain S-box-containing protein